MKYRAVSMRQLSFLFTKAVKGKKQVKMYTYLELSKIAFLPCNAMHSADYRRRRFWHATQDCVAPYVDIILHRGRF